MSPVSDHSIARLGVKLRRLGGDLRHPETHAIDAAVVVAQRLVALARLTPLLHVNRIVHLGASCADVLATRASDASPALPPGLRLRLATLDDVAAIAAIVDVPAALIEARLHEGRVGVVAEAADGRLVGEAWFSIGPGKFVDDAPALPVWDVPADTAWEHAVAVHPSQRGQGLMGHLLGFGAAHLAAEHGVERLACMIQHRNFASLHAHDRAGFSRLKTTTHVYGGGLVTQATQAATALASAVTESIVNIL